MTINKNFVVKNGLEVNQDLILADAVTDRVGIGSTIPRFRLDVSGGIGATDAYLSGIATIQNTLRVGTGGAVFSALGSSNLVGVGTAIPAYLLDVRSPVSTGQTALYVYGDLRVTGDLNVDDIVLDQADFNSLNVSAASVSAASIGVATISTLGVTGVTTTQYLQVTGISSFVGFATFGSGLQVVSGVSTLGVTTATNLTSQQLNVSGVSTLGVTTATNLTSQQLNVSGVSTLGTLQVSPGIVTATSGIITYYGDGSKLANIVSISGVGINTEGGSVGTGATILDFRGSGISTVTVSSGIATINIIGAASSLGQIKSVDDISSSFNGSTQSFPLTFNSVAVTPANEQQILVVLGGVLQNPLTDYSISGSNIIFTTAPSSGLTFSGILFGPAIPISTISDGTVTPSKLSAGGPSWSTSGDLYVSGITTVSTGVGTVRIGVGNTTLLVEGNARITGILTIGTSSLTLDGTNNIINVGTGVTIYGNTGIISATSINVSPTSTTTLGVTTVTNLISQQLNVSGVSTASRFVSTVATGTAPLTVSSTTQVTNLNASQLEGYATATINTGNTIVRRDASGNFSAGIITASLTGNATGLSGTPNLNVGIVTSTKIDLSGQYAQNVVAVSALDIDCSAGNYFTKTINGASTFTVSNIPSSRSYAFTLEVTHTSGTITWFSGVEWPSSTAPTLTTGKTHLFMFVTDDGGTRWRASSLINYTN
jgi:hypothetical protein